jgi:hypothetical protein
VDKQPASSYGATVKRPSGKATQGAKVFVVTAYRCGELNNHGYTVFAGTERQAAIDAAREECNGRGLKYGAEVVEYPSEERVAYFPSFAEARYATRPTVSARRFAAERIGDVILGAHETGTRMAPSGQKLCFEGGASTDVLTAVPTELPPWIAELCEHELVLADQLTSGGSVPAGER